MRLCYTCQSDVAESGGEEPPARWQFETVEGPCEKCGSSYAHRRIH